MHKFDKEQLLDWMKGIREHPDMVEAFWPSQINSKLWIKDTIENQLPYHNNVVIFGAWYGVLADLLNYEKTIVVDIDKDAMLWCSRKYPIHIGRMEDYRYETSPEIVINTVTEHLTQEVYDKWYNNIPKGTYFVIQGNNDYSTKDHVRATIDLNMFNEVNNVQNEDLIMTGEIQYEGLWNVEWNQPTYHKRFMTIGLKDDGQD